MLGRDQVTLGSLAGLAVGVRVEARALQPAAGLLGHLLRCLGRLSGNLSHQYHNTCFPTHCPCSPAQPLPPPLRRYTGFCELGVGWQTLESESLKVGWARSAYDRPEKPCAVLVGKNHTCSMYIYWYMHMIIILRH